MTENVFEIPSIADWLNQFELPDRYIAEHMLRKIRYVSHVQFENWIQSSLNELTSEIEALDQRQRSPTAIFAVTKPFETEDEWGNALPSPPDSSGRIKHSLENYVRSLGKPFHLEHMPSDECMKSRKVNHIIFVDDIIGTGTRFIKFWRSHVSKKVKFWCSRGWCKVWILAYAAHPEGIRNIERHIKALESQDVRTSLLIDRHASFRNNQLMSFLIGKYGSSETWRSNRGYGDTMSPIVFQHGCPNNAPGILWKSNRDWNSLFNNRSVSQDLYPLFNNDLRSGAPPEDLWQIGEYRLAIEFLKRPFSFAGYERLMTTLSLINRGRTERTIREIIVATEVEFQDIITDLQRYGLVDAAHNISRFGRDILQRARHTGNYRRATEYEYKEHFPLSFLGFQREV